MYYVIYGKVIKGDGYGKKIGYPTINITRTFFSKLKKKPNYGIYVGRVFFEEKLYRAGIIIGPKDKKGLPKLEAHLVGYKGNALGKKSNI